MNLSANEQYEDFKVFTDRGSAEAMRSWLEFEGVPCFVDSRQMATVFAVCVLKTLAHRARWIVAQLPVTDAELDFLATGKLPGQEDK
jgi:hypothetical protein